MAGENMNVTEFNNLPFRQKWDEAKNLKGVVWCCAECNDIVDDGSLPKRELVGERYCGNCHALLTRRTNGGQSDPFNFIPCLKPKKIKLDTFQAIITDKLKKQYIYECPCGKRTDFTKWMKQEIKKIKEGREKQLYDYTTTIPDHNECAVFTRHLHKFFKK